MTKQSLKFKYIANNNQVKYKDLINSMVLTLEMYVSRLKEKSNSQLVSNQVAKEYQEKEPQLIKYLHKVRYLSRSFKSFEVKYIPKEQNFRAYLMSKLPITKIVGYYWAVIQETLTAPNIGMDEIYILENAPDSSWMLPIIHYL